MGWCLHAKNVSGEGGSATHGLFVWFDIRVLRKANSIWALDKPVAADLTLGVEMSQGTDAHLTTWKGPQFILLYSLAILTLDYSKLLL